MLYVNVLGNWENVIKYFSSMSFIAFIWMMCDNELSATCVQKYIRIIFICRLYYFYRVACFLFQALNILCVTCVLYQFSNCKSILCGVLFFFGGGGKGVSINLTVSRCLIKMPKNPLLGHHSVILSYIGAVMW